MAKSVYHGLFFKNLVLAVAILTYSSCASIQSPTGGPRDTIPPKVIKETPANLTRNFAAKEIQIQFDEYIKLSNEFTEISISPAVDILPEFKAKKQHLNIKFSDPLEENTTYTINFGKAINDVNESNILKNYTYVFATGNQIDSLSLSGTVTSSLTKEKLKDVTVFILPVSRDSLFGKKRAAFFTTTDSSGSFKLKNLREDDYRIYALNEQGGGDRIYNGQNEEIGFLKDSVHLDKNIDNIRLEIFKAVPKNFLISERKIESDGRVLLTFNKPLLKPTVNIIDPIALNELKTTEISSTRDTAWLWLPELTFDSLKVSVSEEGEPLDTVILRRSKRDEYNRLVIVSDNISGTKLKPKTDVLLKLSSPANTVDESKLTLMEDSVAVKFQLVRRTDFNRLYELKYPWKLEKEYILRADENAFTDIYGNKSKLYIKKFGLNTEDNYGNISIKVSVPDTSQNYLIQWMSEDKKILRQDAISKNTTLNYLTFPTGKYGIRVIYDDNKNGIWDTGNVYTLQQPEETWTFEKIISLRPNWDLEEILTIPKINPD